MQYDQFLDTVTATAKPVILLEGTRKLPDSDRHKLVTLSEKLATDIAGSTFRSGNADGSDVAFADGVGRVDSGRMENILPYPGMRRKHLLPGSTTWSLDDITTDEKQHLYELSVSASPKITALLDMYMASGKKNRLTVKAIYLLRDTLKITGAKSLNLPQASFGVFYVNPAKPFTGGTGHTMRVCEMLDIPVVIQDIWAGWLT